MTTGFSGPKSSRDFRETGPWTIKAVVSYRQPGKFMWFKPMTFAMPVRCWCNAGAMLYQLSYEATQLGAGQFVGRCSRCTGIGDVRGTFLESPDNFSGSKSHLGNCQPLVLENGSCNMFSR